MRHSNRFHTTVWLFLLLVVHTHGVEPQHARQAAVNKSCLWRVVSRDSTVYLLGSVHLLKSGSYPLSDAMEKAFEDASKLVLEVNLDSLDSPDAQQMVLAKALLPEGLAMVINYGSDKVRFLAPVRVGSRIRTLQKILEVVEKSSGMWLVKTDVTVEIEHGTKPAMKAEVLYMYVVQ